MRLPADARTFADQRGYLPASVPALKRVAAAAGDRVCGHGGLITINGHVAALRLPKDGRGRDLPRWDGCQTLKEGQILLLNQEPRSFDGRYFGITRVGDVIGRFVPFWEL